MEETYKQSKDIGKHTRENRLKEEYYLWELTLYSLVEIY
jgi:hypothetical protein